MKGQMRQGVFPFLVLQTGECGLHLICGGAGLNDHSCHFKLLINCSAKKWTYFLGVISCLGVIICIGTKKRGYVCACVYVCVRRCWKVKTDDKKMWALCFYQHCACFLVTYLSLLINWALATLQQFKIHKKVLHFS